MTKTDRLDPDNIKENLKTKRLGKKILVYNSTSSTNDVAAEYANNKNNDGLVIFTEKQTKGRGRASNKWISPKSDSLLCSILLTKPAKNSELLSLACAVAVAETIGSHAKIKWPNDIICNGKKIAGILLESKTKNNYTAHIIGIGINCHQATDSFPAELKSIATSIDIETKTICDRTSLAKRLITSLEHWLKIADEHPKKITAQWSTLSIQLGHRVTVAFEGTTFSGNCIGVDPAKGLILQLDTGSVRMFDAVHTTIVK